MATKDDLLDASYKGVGFLVRRENESGGKKVAIHEYPGSDKRFVEELGRLQPRFSVEAIVHGDDVLNSRVRLTQAISSPGIGTLIHPYLGQVECVCVNHDIATSQNTIGEVVFSLDFVQSEGPQSLIPVLGDINGVFSAASNARSVTTAAATSRLNPVSNLNSAQRMAARLTESLDVIQTQVSNVVNPATDTLNAVTRQIKDVKARALSIVRTPIQLTVATRGVFDAVLSLADTPADLRNEWRNLTNFGAVERFLSNGQRSRTVGTVRTPINRTTAKRILEDDNLRVIDQQMRIEALINSFEAEASASFGDDADLQEVRQQLSDDYDRIIDSQDDVIATSNIGDEVLTGSNVTVDGQTVSEALAFRNSIGFDPGVRAAMEALKVATFDVLARDVKNTYTVDDVDIGLTDITLATYQLYGALDLIDTLAGLNSDKNHAHIREPIRTVSQ